MAVEPLARAARWADPRDLVTRGSPRRDQHRAGPRPGHRRMTAMAATPRQQLELACGGGRWGR